MSEPRAAWGSRLVDGSPPIDDATSGSVRAVFVRLVRELQARRDLGWTLGTVFSGIPDLSQQGLVRILEILGELEHDVLPRLRTSLRTESRAQSSWDPAPRRGTLDAVGTFRRAASTGLATPLEWRSRSAERWVATPVNLYAVALLGSVVSTFEQVGRHVNLLPRERLALATARHQVLRFLETTPLGSIASEPLGRLARLRRDARARAAEYRGVEALERLHDRLQEMRLDEVHWDAERLSANFCYEGLVALSFLLALAEGHAPGTHPGGVVFRSARRTVRVDLRNAALRGPTLYLECEGEPQRCLVVEALNYRSDLAKGHIEGTLYRARGRPVALFTPSLPAADESWPGLHWDLLGGDDPALALERARALIAAHL